MKNTANADHSPVSCFILTPSAVLCTFIKTGCSAVRLARVLWEHEAEGSNPPTPTIANAINTRYLKIRTID